MKQLIRHILHEHISEIQEARKYTDDEVEIEARKFNTIKDFREKSPNFYSQAKRKGLMPKFKEFLSSKIINWSDEELEKSASNFKTLKDYINTSGSGYKTAKGKGKDFFDRITSHMPRVKVWTYDEAKKEALKYENFADFRKNSPAYHQSEKNGWNEEFMQFLKLAKGEWRKYTKDMVISDVNKSHNKVEFRDKFPLAYKAARENGWYDEVTQPLVNVIDDRTRLIYVYEFPDKSVYVGLTVNEKRRKTGHLNIEDIESPVAQHIINTGMEPQYKVIVKDLTPKEAQESEGCTEEKYRLNGWKILNRYKTGSLGACRRFWTKEMAQKESEKYKTRAEFKKGSKNAYQAAQKYGWLGDLTKDMVRGDRVVWNYDKTKEFAKQFNSRAQMKYASQAAYDRARTQGWLDEFFPKK